MIRIFRVSGCSMEPTLSDGDYVVTTSWFLRVREERLVVARHHQIGVIVKRLSKKVEQGFWLKSDNPQGSDTNTLGLFTPKQLLGVVFFTIRKRQKYLAGKKGLKKQDK